MRDGRWLIRLREGKVADRALAPSQDALDGYFVSEATDLTKTGPIAGECPSLD